jgi:hypothetical protein
MEAVKQNLDFCSIKPKLMPVNQNKLNLSDTVDRKIPKTTKTINNPMPNGI